MDLTNRNLAIASAFAEELARSGVEIAVISPGSRSTPLAVAFDREPAIETKVVVDERSAGFVGLGGALATGKPVALVCTSGTAAANYLPAIAEADLSSVPLLVLTADRPPELRGIGAGQTIDQIKLYGNLVRMFSEFGEHDADDAGLIHSRSLACRAFAASAGDPRPGPVHVNFGFREPLAPVSEPASVTATSDLALEGRGSEGGGPLTSVAPVDGSPSVRDVEGLEAMLAEADRIMVIAGRGLPRGSIDAVAEFCSRHKVALLAEPTSGLRSGHHSVPGLIWRYDAILARTQDAGKADLVPQLIIRLGETPTSKRLRQWLSGLESTRQVIVDPAHGWHDPTQRADLLLRCDPGMLFAATGDPGAPDRALLDVWIEAQRALPEPAAAADGISRPEIHRAVIETSGDGDVIYTASSLAVRDQEAFAPPTETAARYLANRGANGIDGLIASGVGAAVATGARTVVLTGDVGLRHDVGSLESLVLLDPDLRLVVINDGGGRIFERLPQRESMDPGTFQRLLLTPFDLDLESLARAYGLGYLRPTDVGSLRQALSMPGPVLVEVIPAD